jgi:ribosomal-protein-alanine N-acetyltransferase
VRHYLRDLREDVGYALFIFAASSGSLIGGLASAMSGAVSQSCARLLRVGADYAKQRAL